MKEVTTTPKTTSTASIGISTSAHGHLTGAQPEVPQKRAGSLPLVDAVDLFCQSCATPATSRSYRAALSPFLNACSDRGVIECSQVTPSVIASFPASLAGLAASTRHHRLSVVKAFLRWTAKAEWCDSTCATVITPGRVVRRTGALTLSEEDTRKLLSAAQTWRDRALLWTLSSTAARIGEVVHATVADFDGQSLRLSGKTGTRSVPVGPGACGALDWYLRHRQPLDQAAPLFASREGRLSERQAREVVYAACRRAKLAPKRPHTLRHAAATRWLKAGVTLIVASATLGHARPSTSLDFYLDATAQDLARGLSSDPLWGGDDPQISLRPGS
ncbi:MAG TPA: tyrosine-type recombinase/integrase [Candidatus Nanopelagicaceae bacterium]|nr:tyrosine-type recombinase/integrase [Candidatus Nanopelagicaceae bacterium]